MHKYEMWADGGWWRSRQGERGGEEEMNNCTERLNGLICISLSAVKEFRESYICRDTIYSSFRGSKKLSENITKCSEAFPPDTHKHIHFCCVDV